MGERLVNLSAISQEPGELLVGCGIARTASRPNRYWSIVSSSFPSARGQPRLKWASQ